MSLVAAGCVVSDPPEYGVAKKTVPVLDLNQATPKVFWHWEYASGTPVTVSVPVRSEDAGDPLFGALYLDYHVKYQPPPPDGGAAAEIFTELNRGQIPAGTLTQTHRSFILSYTVPNTPGCHTVSLVVTHFQSLDSSLHPSNPNDLGIATWWVNIDNDTNDPTKMTDCPVQGATQ